MQYVHLGSSSLKVSRFCLGTMMFGARTDEGESIRITRAAVEAGVNFIDTADLYTNGVCETILAKALAGIRDRVVLASKGGVMHLDGWPNDFGPSRFHLVRAVEASLKRLETDRIDVYYIHWPFDQMNLDELMRTLDDLVRAGKILYAACSNFPAWLVCRSNAVAGVNRSVPLVCGQYPYNLIERGIEVEILPMAQSLRFGITIYRPLAIGVLTGKYLVATPDQTRGQSDERIARWTAKYHTGLEQLTAFAQARGHTAADAASAWVVSHPAVTSVVVGITRFEQLQANLKGFVWSMTPEERQTISGFFLTEVTEESGGRFPGFRRRPIML